MEVTLMSPGIKLALKKDSLLLRFFKKSIYLITTLQAIS